MLKAVLLDFDGVIVESVDIKTQAFADYFGQHFPRHVDEIVRYHMAHNGVSRIIKFQYIYETILGIKFAEATKKSVCAAFSNLVKEKVISCALVPGAEDFLRLYWKKIPLYLSSATPEVELVEIIEKRNLRKYFASVFGFPVLKDKAVEDVMQLENCLPDQVLMVGDSPEDWKTAQRKGIHFIGRKDHYDFSDSPVQAYDDMFGVASGLNAYQSCSEAL